MSEAKQLSPAQRLVGDFAPKLAELTEPLSPAMQEASRRRLPTTQQPARQTLRPALFYAEGQVGHGLLDRLTLCYNGVSFNPLPNRQQRVDRHHKQKVCWSFRHR